jgi:glycosyltransferase involved in cell wall biosynthesis
MRLLFFSNTSLSLDINGLQGSGNWSSSLVSAILKYSHEIEISYAFHDAHIKTIISEEINSRLKIYKIPLNISKTKIGKLINYWFTTDFNSNSLSFYQKLITDISPNIIQIFGFESPFVRLINKTKVPVIIHFQGFLPSSIYKFYSRFSILDILSSTQFKLMLKGQTALQEKKYLLRQINLEKNLYSECQYILGRTSWDNLISKIVAPKAKYIFCQEILREPFYINEWSYNRHSQFQIFSVARESFSKNLDLIFEATSILEQYHSEFDFAWKIAGLTEVDLSPRIMKKRGYNSRKIQLLGVLGAEALVKEMLRSDLFVLPSAIENSPNALMEAMLIGMPVLGTYAGGISSLVEQDKTGFLVPEGDPYSLAGAILKLSENFDKIRNLGQAARKEALIRNDPRKIVENLTNVYNNIIS